jgi:hypothetical protein
MDECRLRVYDLNPLTLVCVGVRLEQVHLAALPGSGEVYLAIVCQEIVKRSGRVLCQSSQHFIRPHRILSQTPLNLSANDIV